MVDYHSFVCLRYDRLFFLSDVRCITIIYSVTHDQQIPT